MGARISRKIFFSLSLVAVLTVVAIALLKGSDFLKDHGQAPEIPEINFAQSVLPVVVRIPTTDGQISVQRGTAVAVGGRGHLLTASHVVGTEEEGRSILVMFEGREYAASVIEQDTEKDIAWLSVDGLANRLSPFKTGGRTSKGDHVILVGFPSRHVSAVSPEPVVTRGQVVGHRLVGNSDRQVEQIIIRASMSGGGSGGAVLTYDLEVVGIMVSALFHEHRGHRFTDRVFAVSPE